jgi:hypothetical protein
MGGRILRRALVVALGVVAGTAGAARAQPDSVVTPVREDSLGLAADAEPVAHRRLRGMGRCGFLSHGAVTDTVQLRRLRAFPACVDAPLPAPVGRTLVSVSVRGDCHTWYRLDAFRSESRREYRIRVRWRYGGCRAGGFADAWLELPALPPGWTVAVTDEKVPDDLEISGPEWSYIGARDGR